ncbi:MAG: HAD hydrolase-like protein [Gammaproteobacteria bacterium]|nr:HAD hydrolase-like protein [Gammaproteobacteria bacterium]MBT8110411.1 HAD hydrolase-like protein [Gammaproteobacteria bacterium]NND46581.1 HAD hydrolase-like protein [Woeseiaceae bacterium]NNL45111.1 HAD hydrolase-like protein [Woeseiaceae bacterium]
MSVHIYFDLDGTLTDPYEGISKCILYALDELGIAHPSDEYLHSCIGPPLYDTFPEMVGKERTLRAIDLYRERFVDVGWQENKPYEGILDALETISAAGCTLFVATSKPRVHAGRIVQHFGMGQYIEQVYGCELDGTRSKKTELLKYAIAKNSGAERRTMVGDRKHDVVGAIENGMRPIGVSYGYGSVEELSSAGATDIVSTPGSLPEIVLKDFA